MPNIYKALSNTSIDNTSWTAITVPLGVACQGVFAKLSDHAAWKFKLNLASSAEFNVASVWEDRSSKFNPGDTLFWVKSVGASGTLEVLFSQ